MGIERVDSDKTSTFRDYIKSKLFYLPTIRLIQMVIFVSVLTIGLVILTTQTSDENDLLTFWAIIWLVTEIPITIIYKGDTSSQDAVSHGTSVILSTMKYISIEHPLKFYGIPGIGFLLIGLFFAVWTIQEFTNTGRIITNISLIGVGSIIFGMILTMTSIMLFSLVNVVRERR